MNDRSEVLFENTADILAEYERGFVGVYSDPSADARLYQHIDEIGGYADGGMACRMSGIEGTGAGKLSIPFMATLRLYPGSLPGGAQKRGDCVSWSTRNAGLVSYCASLLYGKNEGKNDAPPASIAAVENGVLSTESFYWYRGYDGDGWTCTAAADVAMKSCGLVLRQPYADLGFDLTTYSPNTAGKWGRQPPPSDVRQMTSQYLIRNATNCTTWEQVRDLLANGYALSTCGMEAWSSQRDQHGICNRKAGTWAHAIAAIGADDRDEVKRRYGAPLLLMHNSWGEYLSGPRTIFGTAIEIPKGCYWTRWDDAARRTFIALGTGKGWAAKKMPDWGLGGVL